MVRSVSLAALAALVVSGCGNEAVVLQPPPRHYELSPGDHRIAVDVPYGWTVVNQGREIRIRQGTIEKGVRTIEIHDLGPAGLEGVRQEVEQARDLWSAGRDLDARWRLRRIEVPREWFATATQSSNFWSSMRDLTGARRGAGYDEVEDAFTALIDTVRTLDPPPFEAAVLSALQSVEDLKSRREVGPRGITKIDGHDAMLLETHSRLAHENPRRYVVIRNRSRLLALWMDRSPTGAPYPVFDTVVNSLRIRTQQGPI